MKPPKSPAQRPQPKAVRPAIAPGRLWAFRILALLLPLLAVGFLEVVLRLTGYGYNPSFLQKTRINGQECFINNDTFSLRFFPPELARWPGSLMIPVAS